MLLLRQKYWRLLIGRPFIYCRDQLKSKEQVHIVTVGLKEKNL